MRGIEFSGEILQQQQYGGKASGLFFLQGNGFNVPPFYVIGYERLRSILKGESSLDELVSTWREQYQISTDSLWAVRSSAGIEDGAEQSFAGLFNSQINVSPEEMIGAISEVLRAFDQVKELNYEVASEFSFAIVIQEMIVSEYSGVIFSHNPLDPSEKVAHLNLVPGLGENLVSGRVEAFMVQKEKRKIEYLNTEQTFSGERFQAGLEALTVSGTELKKAVEPFIKPLFKGADKLAKLKGHPVDCEFTIANGQLYWVQVRPITSRAAAIPLAVYDNANIGENFPGLTMPLSISFTRYGYQKAYTSMNAFLGMSKAASEANAPLLAKMATGIYGKVYYHVTAWQKLLYQLPFGKRTSKLIIKLWNMDPAPFEKPARSSSFLGYLKLFGNLFRSFFSFNRLKKDFDALYDKEMNAFDPSHLEGLNHSELVNYYRSFEKRLGDNWVVPVLNGFFALITFSALKWIFRRSRLAESHPNFINDILYSQGDVVSVQIVKDFHALSETIRETKALKDLFEQEEDETVLARLATEHPAFNARVQRYLKQFGERATEGELKMETINYQDDPRLFIQFLRSSASVSFTKQADTTKFSYHDVLKKAYRNNPLKRWVLKRLIKRTIPRIRDRENYRFFRTKSFGIARRVFRAIGKELASKQLIDTADDFLYLEFDEIMNPALSGQFREIVEHRKADYEEYALIDHTHRYIETEQGLEAVEKSAAGHAKDVLKGTGCCSGVVSGPVVIIDGPELKDESASGGIFVAHHFEPGWINLFAQASGVISERGNLLSHTAILCREMGIPSIVGVKGLMEQIKAGDPIQMNGATGEVFLLEAEAENEE